MNSPSIRRLAAVMVLVTVVGGCGSSAASAPGSAAASLLASATPGQAATPTTIPSPPATVDASTMHGKLLMGYQGWFSCPTDGSNTNWFHWFNANVPDATHLRVDMWPDESELPAAEKCATSLKYPDGRPASVYSASNPATVLRHFGWMRDYGIDGVFVQRFLTEPAGAVWAAKRNAVLDNERAAAEATGRVFAVEIDISNTSVDPNLVAEIEADWKYLVDTKKVTDSRAYLHQDGKPVLGIYGFGLNLYPTTPAQAMAIVDFFENNPEPRYRATLFGGVPSSWRTLDGDTLSDPAWADYYCSLDVISPWSVGRFETDAQADAYRSKMVADMKRATECGAEYMPVVWPGTSFHNNANGGEPTGQETKFNLIPRRGGDFYWRQVYNAVSLGVPEVFNAMFDEVDEDTAMFKVAATTADQPAGVELLSMDADGEKLPSDWYLHLAGAATMMLRKDIPLTPAIPLATDGTLARTFATPAPTARAFHVRIGISTTSDWTNLDVSEGTQWANPVLSSRSAEASYAAGDQFPLALGQTLARANTGARVEMAVDVDLLDLMAGQRAVFVLGKGNLGSTTLTFMNYLGAKPVVVQTITYSLKAENGYRFTLPAELFITPNPSPAAT
jgi:hypothetical protein